MTEKICPVCNRPNISTAKRCWYCQSLLEDDQVVPGLPTGDQETADAGITGDDEVPEWLARVRQRKAIEEMQQTRSLSPENLPPEEEPARKPENLPESQAEESAAPDDSGSSQMPKWLQGLGTPTPSEGVTKSLQSERTPESENYSWLEKLQSWKNRDQEEPESGSSKAEPPEEQIPAESKSEDWLTEFLAPSEQTREEILPANQELPAEVAAAPDESAANEILAESSGQATEDETYDFYTESQTAVKEEQPVPPQEMESEQSASDSALETSMPATPAEGTEEIMSVVAPADNSDLDWLSHYQEPEPETPLKKSTPSAPFLGVQPSDWSEPSPEPDIEAETETPDEEVEPAILPTWMQNLRPIETLPQGNLAPSEETVSEGPLAGIEGALVGTGLNAAFEKPPVYTNKVQVNDRQSLRAELLQNLLAEPDEAKTPAEEKKPIRRMWLKWVISLIMLAAVFGVLIMAPGTSLLPGLFPPETANAYRLIKELPDDKPVFIVADFEAGLSGEMGFAAQSLLEHLMLRNIPMAVLSTNPVGSTLMDAMLVRSQGLVSSYDTSTQVVNFGYLAGSSIGMQGLISDLRTTIPFDRNLTPAWANPVLQNVNRLEDLGALVIVTDDADTGRYWIEQVQSSLNGVPLILVSSAQAAPMLQPYYVSGQVSALVSGISGGTAYEQILKLPGNSSYFFGAYQVLTLAVIALLFVGGFVSLVKPVDGGSKG